MVFQAHLPFCPSLLPILTECGWDTSSQYNEMSPNMARGEIAPLPNHEEEENDFDSGFGSGGFLSNTSISECNRELEILKKNKEELLACNFYYPDLNSMSARTLLKNNPIGSFVVRDSSDSKYLFSLSVKTQQGATSVRILYLKGYFLFDSDERIRDRMPRFDSVLSLIDHHVHLSQVGANKSWRWEDSSGKKRVPVELSKPIRKTVSSLSHLCTLTINQCVQDPINSKSLNQLPCLRNSKIKQCLEEYPFRI